MVNFQKWIIIIAGIVFLGLFTQEAAATGLTGTLQRTGLSGSSIGSGIAATGIGAGQGIAGFFRGILSPFWEIRNIVSGFMNLGNLTPSLEDPPEQGGGTNPTTGSGGAIDSVPVPIIQGRPDTYTTTTNVYPDYSGQFNPAGWTHAFDYGSAEHLALTESGGGGGTNLTTGFGGGNSTGIGGTNEQGQTAASILSRARAAGYSLGSS